MGFAAFDRETYLDDGRRIDGEGPQEPEIKKNGGSIEDLVKFIGLAKQSAEVVSNIFEAPTMFKGKPRLMETDTLDEPAIGQFKFFCEI